MFLFSVNVLYFYHHYQARQTRPNSGGVAEGLPTLDKGGGCNFFLLFKR